MLFLVVTSLIAIASGFMPVFNRVKNREGKSQTTVLLTTTILTSVTDFSLPFDRFIPSHAVSIPSLHVLAVAVFALYVGRLERIWRRTFCITVVMALYLNVFVLLAQLFAKIPLLKSLGRTKAVAPIKLAELLVLLLFVVLGILAAKNSSSQQVRTA